MALNARIGIATGNAIAGIVGDLQPRFSVQGEAMKMIAHLEPTGEKGAVHCSADFLESVRAWREGDKVLSAWSITEAAHISGNAVLATTPTTTYILRIKDMDTVDGAVDSIRTALAGVVRQDTASSAGISSHGKATSAVLHPLAPISRMFMRIVTLPQTLFHRNSSVSPL